MRIKEYTWDISLLKKMELELLNHSSLDSHYRDEDIKIIEELLALAKHQAVIQNWSFEDRITRVEQNRQYLMEQIDEKQMLYLHLLQKKFHSITPIYSFENTKFQIEDVLALLEEFINWFPYKKLGQILQLYYEKYFSTHFYYCKNQNIFANHGSTYQLNYFLIPFIIVTKGTFVETFITLTHEMAHVLTYALELEFRNIKFGNLFSELDGKYFEELARKFLEEKGIHTEYCLKSSIDSYNAEIEFLQKIKLSQIWRTFFTYETIEELLCETYSYLGALDLLERYQGDYEKQLYDFVQLFNVSGNNMSEYLKNAGFSWRQDDFKVLEKRRKSLVEK